VSDAQKLAQFITLKVAGDPRHRSHILHSSFRWRSSTSTMSHRRGGGRGARYVESTLWTVLQLPSCIISDLGWLVRGASTVWCARSPTRWSPPATCAGPAGRGDIWPGTAPSRVRQQTSAGGPAAR
jgi:hypothetical protein